MKLVADRFIRFDDGTVRDLATGERVTLVECTVSGVAEQVARRDRCLARLESPVVEDLTLVDFGLIGESRWIEAWRPASEVGAPQTPEDSAVVDAIAATLDGLGSRDLRRLYVKAPDGARLEPFHAVVAREARVRGFIPLSASVVGDSPGIASVLASRAIVLFGDARCAFKRLDGFEPGESLNSIGRSDDFGAGVAIARAVALLRRTVCMVAAIVARVCDHANVAALRLMLGPSPPRSMALASSAPRAVFAQAPQSVVQPAAPVSYADPELPSLFPRSEQIAQVAETAGLASFDGAGYDTRASWPFDLDVARRCDVGDATVAEPGAPPGKGRWNVSEEAGADRAPAPAPDAAAGEAAPDIEAVHDVGVGADVEAEMRYPPLRLVGRRTRWEIAEGATPRLTGSALSSASAPECATDRRAAECPAIDVPVVTTMVSGYGEVADGLVARGRWAAASRALRAELAAFERRKLGHDAARTSIALGRLHLAMGEVAPAARCFDRAGELASAREPDCSARLIGEALRWSGVAALDDGDLERSERLLRSALAAIGPEADPFQAFGIELALARCLFWQGRAREIVLPVADALASSATQPQAASVNAQPSDGAMTAIILRVERWRRAARIALADGDLSSAGDAIARACRIARGEDEHDVRAGGCRLEPSERRHPERRQAGASARGRRGRAAEHMRMFEALRAACHLDAARLQFAIGDTATGGAHLRHSLALSRTPARTARVQLLQLAQFRNGRTSEARRRFERLSAALRQPRVPKLVRIQARYLIDARSRRSQELVTFLDRHGDTALAGYGHPDRRGGSPMLEAFQDVLRICHETPDDLTALARVSAYMRDQLRALSVAIYGLHPSARIVAQVSQHSPPATAAPPRARATDAPPHAAGIGAPEPSTASREPFEAEQAGERASPHVGATLVRYAVAGSTRILSPELAMRAIESGLPMPPTYRPDALDAAAPVRYGGAAIGAIVVRWSIDATIDHLRASALIGAAAAAVSPQLRAALDRRGADADSANSAGAHDATRLTEASPARTLGLLGISSAIDTLRHTITRVSSAPFHVLIEGESGSGKELVARALHQHGPRRHRRFCAVNCAAFTDELLEAELFGHTRGAFTGALTERAGLFEEADGGTLFLDEIGELSPRGQAKLLRVIQDGETRRIGENLPRRVDTRIVAATNRSLREEAEAGRFREDLLYRLDVIRIMVPPLRARPEDVAVLARAFWDEAIARLGSRATLDPAALTALARYHWPGNVRELHNAIMALAVHAPRRGRVTASLLPASLLPASIAAPPRAVAKAAQREPESLPFEGPLEDARRAFESRYIRAALARAGGSPSRAARDLGLTRQGLKKLMARLELDDDAGRNARSKKTTARKERPP